MIEMNSDFKNALVEFLDSECDDYGMGYEILEDTYSDYCFPSVDVEIHIQYAERSTVNTFGWDVAFNKTTESLCIEMCEDSWEHICWYDSSVKYFWMAVAPEIWGKQ